MTVKTQLDIEEVVKKIVNGYNPEKIILFGSYVWGKPNKHSDYDLLIIKEDKNNFFEDQSRIRQLVGRKAAIDVLIYTPNEISDRLKLGDFFVSNIINKGKILYEK